MPWQGNFKTTSTLFEFNQMTIVELIELRKDLLRMFVWSETQQGTKQKKSYLAHWITKAGQELNYRCNTTKYVPR